jgi:hypothetical protein
VDRGRERGGAGAGQGKAGGSMSPPPSYSMYVPLVQYISNPERCIYCAPAYGWPATPLALGTNGIRYHDDEQQSRPMGPRSGKPIPGRVRCGSGRMELRVEKGREGLNIVCAVDYCGSLVRNSTDLGLVGIE